MYWNLFQNGSCCAIMPFSVISLINNFFVREQGETSNPSEVVEALMVSLFLTSLLEGYGEMAMSSGESSFDMVVSAFDSSFPNARDNKSACGGRTSWSWFPSSNLVCVPTLIFSVLLSKNTAFFVVPAYPRKVPTLVSLSRRCVRCALSRTYTVHPHVRRRLRLGRRPVSASNGEQFCPLDGMQLVTKIMCINA